MSSDMGMRIFALSAVILTAFAALSVMPLESEAAVGDTVILVPSGMTGSVKFHDNTRTVKEYAAYQSNFSSVNFNNITAVQQYAFYESDLISIDAGKISSIGQYAFAGSDGILFIQKVGNAEEYGGDFPTWTAANQVPWYGGTMSNITTAIIDEGVTSIGNYAFDGASNDLFKTINLPDTITEIGDYSFYGASHLQIVSHSNFQTIGQSAFQSLQNLQDFNFGPVKSVKAYAFSGYGESSDADTLSSKATVFEIPASISSVGYAVVVPVPGYSFTLSSYQSSIEGFNGGLWTIFDIGIDPIEITISCVRTVMDPDDFRIISLTQSNRCAVVQINASSQGGLEAGHIHFGGTYLKTIGEGPSAVSAYSAISDSVLEVNGGEEYCEIDRGIEVVSGQPGFSTEIRLTDPTAKIRSVFAYYSTADYIRYSQAILGEDDWL